MKRLSLLAFALLAVASTGCTPSPEKVCEKMAELAKSDKKEDVPLLFNRASKTDGRVKQCIGDAQEVKSTSKDDYECVAKGIMEASSFEPALTSARKCLKDDPCRTRGLCGK
jgi:hypothetical protein